MARKTKPMTIGEVILTLLPVYGKFRNNRLYKIWKRGALRIYKNRCPISHETENLDVHHIADAKSNPHLRYVPYNGIPLLTEYHTGFHKWNGGSKKPCSMSDLIQWLETYNFPNNVHKRRAARLARVLQYR